jgi:hypothetical protein
MHDVQVLPLDFSFKAHLQEFEHELVVLAIQSAFDALISIKLHSAKPRFTILVASSN